MATRTYTTRRNEFVCIGWCERARHAQSHFVIVARVSLAYHRLAGLPWEESITCVRPALVKYYLRPTVVCGAFSRILSQCKDDPPWTDLGD